MGQDQVSGQVRTNPLKSRKRMVLAHYGLTSEAIVDAVKHVLN